MPAVDVPTHPDWKAPANDSDLLIWPTPAELIERTRDNAQLLASAEHVRIGGISLPELRRAQRAAVGHTDDALLIASGHQTELYHPGVWVKDVLCSTVARRIGGRAMHLAVDTDAPKHLQLRWPGGSMPITDDPALGTAAWSSLLDMPSAGHLNDLTTELMAATAGWPFAPVAPQFIDSLRAAGPAKSDALSAGVADAIHALDHSLGLHYETRLASPIWQGLAYLVYVHHLLSRAGELAEHYNSALAEYRATHRVRTASRPMPDVAVFHSSCEAPFWLDDLVSGTRSRPTVFQVDGGWVLTLPSGAEFRFDPSTDGWAAAERLNAWLSEAGVRLSPRALTLTMFFRLLLVDQFVHGIGGARYDQVTDAIIARLFKLRPPAMSVTTATLYLPQALGRSRVCMPCIVQEGHRLRHSVLGEEKMRLVAEIAGAPRRSRERAEKFLEMHRLLKSTVRHPSLERWERKYAEERQKQTEEQALFDRELFYAMQPRERLVGLIERYGEAFA